MLIGRDSVSGRYDYFFVGNFFQSERMWLFPEILEHCDNVVGILYDFIPLIFAKDYLQDTNTNNSYAFSLESMRWSRHFFCISKSTLNDACKYAGIPYENLTCIYGGVNRKKFSKRIISDEKTANDMIMIPGDDRRKNYERACVAFAKAYASGRLPLDANLRVICAHGKRFEKNIQDALKCFDDDIKRHIIVHNRVSDAELIGYLHKAKASIFPSIYEGMGLPILESLSCGVPVISSSASSCKEFNITECQFDPYSIGEMAGPTRNINKKIE